MVWSSRAAQPGPAACAERGKALAASCPQLPHPAPSHYCHHCYAPCLPQRNGKHDHESYYGDRTKESLLKFADDLAAAVSALCSSLLCCVLV